MGNFAITLKGPHDSPSLPSFSSTLPCWRRRPRTLPTAVGASRPSSTGALRGL